MSQQLPPGNFGYGNKVRCSLSNDAFNTKEITGTVVGKIKESDLYLILFDRSILASHGYYKQFADLTFGTPNRHLVLQWGKYYGYYNEYIVPSNILELVV